MGIGSLFVSQSVRLTLIFLSIGFSFAGVASLRSLPSVSEWAPMEVARPVEDLPAQCGATPSVIGELTEFTDAEGNLYSPAVRMGETLHLTSFRLLDRDIEGVFKASLVATDPATTVQLTEFIFSEGMFPGVTAGCRAQNFPLGLNIDNDPKLTPVEVTVRAAARPTRWRLVQQVDIVGATSETLSSERFWIIPRTMDGKFTQRPVVITDPFFGRGD